MSEEERVDKIARARAKAREAHQDDLALEILERMRQMALERGWVRKKKQASTAPAPKQTSEERVGGEVYVPVPGQEVGSGARPSHRDPQFLSGLLAATIAQKGWKTRLDVAAMASRWPAVVGPHVAEHSFVESFSDDGVLVVRAKSTAWEAQLRALASLVDKRLAEVLGEGVVKELEIKGPHQPSWKHGRWSVPGRGVRDTYD